jgi:hypothetical protein
MIRKSGNRFSEKIMLKQEMADEHASTQLKHVLAVRRMGDAKGSGRSLSSGRPEGRARWLRPSCASHLWRAFYLRSSSDIFGFWARISGGIFDA